MIKLKLFYSLISISILSACGTYPSYSSRQNPLDNMPNEPGKCYAKCLSPDIVDEKQLSFDIYTGNDPNILDQYVKTEEIEIAPESSKWVKKKADRNCLSADPNDCLVWCMVTEPAQHITVKNMLIDTTVTRDFKTKTHNIDFVSVAGGQQVWMTVVCNPDELLLKEVQHVLNEEGYDISVEMVQGVFGQASKKALVQFQKDNNLHIGGLTEESMHALSIEY